MSLAVVVDQRGQPVINPKDHRATVPAVAAVRAAERFELLTMNGGAAVAAVAAVHVQRDVVDEGRDSHGWSLLSVIRKHAKGGPDLWATLFGDCGTRLLCRGGGLGRA